MDLSPAARRLIFGLLVCVLVGLGVYLIGPAAHGAGSTARHHGPAGPKAVTTATGPATLPAPGQPGIYQWLPFTQAGLGAAASVVVKFGDAYGSFSYTQNAAAYVAPMLPITSGQLVSQIEAAYSTPGVAAARLSGKQVAVGTATIGSIRAFGPSSLTFLVQVAQQLTDTTGRNLQMTVYAVTVTGSGTNWQVSDVELASAGNS
jgi:nucleoid-associated protein YgaU